MNTKTLLKVMEYYDRQLEKAKKCPGGKIRSKGKGRGLGTGKGKGPIGRQGGTDRGGEGPVGRGRVRFANEDTKKSRYEELIAHLTKGDGFVSAADGKVNPKLMQLKPDEEAVVAPKDKKESLPGVDTSSFHRDDMKKLMSKFKSPFANTREEAEEATQSSGLTTARRKRRPMARPNREKTPPVETKKSRWDEYMDYLTKGPHIEAPQKSFGITGKLKGGKQDDQQGPSVSGKYKAPTQADKMTDHNASVAEYKRNLDLDVSVHPKLQSRPLKWSDHNEE